MKKLICFILLFSTVVFTQTPVIQKKLVTEFSITGSNTRVAQLKLPHVDSYALDAGIPWKGAWSTYIYCTLVNGTPGTLTIKTKTGDWQNNVSLNDSTVIEASRTMETGLLIYDIHVDKPAYSKWLYITRTGAGSASVARFEIHQAWVEYTD